jgi:signal transduction histidine kinase
MVLGGKRQGCSKFIMIPNFSFGILGAQTPIKSIIEKVFGPLQEVVCFNSAADAETFLLRVSLPDWIILIADWECLRNSTSLFASLQDIYLKIKTFHLILWSTQGLFDDLISQLISLENIHVIGAAPYEPADELEHHFQNIKSSLDSYWLYAKATDILHLYEDSYMTESESSKKVLSFLESVAKVIPARSINIFLLQIGAKSFARETGVNAPPFESIPASVVQELFEFSDTCLTYIVPPHQLERMLERTPATAQDGTTFVATFRYEGILGFIVYDFELCTNLGLVRALCTITSREIFHLYRSAQLRSQHKTLKAISEIGGLDAEKREVLYKILFQLKSHFHADGVAVVELVIDEDGKPGFEKTYFDRARKGVEPLPYKGFAQHCVANGRALLITDVIERDERPFGVGFEFDPDRLGVDQGKEVRIDTFRAPHASEDEKSLMYFPFRLGDSAGAIKIGDFTRRNAFDLKDLRALGMYADGAASLLANIHAIEGLRGEIARHSAQKEMIEIAEVLFFYREITLGIFHQVRGHLDNVKSEMLMLEMISGGKERSSDLAEHFEEAKDQIRLAKEFIDKAQHRGLTLSPIEQACELVQDVIRPAIEYARKRIKGTNVEIVQSLTSEQYETRLDIDLAMESIINLLNNAIWAVKANRSTKKKIFIAVRKTPEGDFARVEIDDSGIGIPPENFKKLFTPGFTTRPEGTGFGLYFTRRLIEYFGGSCSVLKSSPDKGTTVVALFPLTE